MNIENVKKAIAIMKRAGEVNMEYWQTSKHGYDFKTTEAELHECGTAACFAGWVAVSPEWKQSGGGVADGGIPEIKGLSGILAISEWLGINYIDVNYLICGNCIEIDGLKDDMYSKYYNKLWSNVNANDVIEKLEELLGKG